MTIAPPRTTLRYAFCSGSQSFPEGLGSNCHIGRLFNNALFDATLEFFLSYQGSIPNNNLPLNPCL